MKLYHRTAHAAAILAEGFKDTTGYYLTSQEWTGVWFSDIPLDASEGAKGHELLTIEMPADVIAEYEWVSDEIELPGGENFKPPYREWMIPAEVVNRYGPPVVVEES